MTTIITYEALQEARARREQAKLPPPPLVGEGESGDVALRIARCLEELKGELVGLRADLRQFERRLTIRFGCMLAVASIISVTTTVYLLLPAAHP
ncbi:MAG: hypothetical protein WCK65_00865 [Rhodospirillaceae bacterium]